MNPRQKLSLFHQFFCSALVASESNSDHDTSRYNFNALGKENPIINRLSDQEVDLILSIFSQISHESYIDQFQILIENIIQRKLISVKSLEYSPKWNILINAGTYKDTFVEAPVNILKLFEQLNIPICIDVRLCSVKYHLINEKILSEKMVTFLSMKVERGMRSPDTRTLFSQQAMRGDSDEKINGNLFAISKFWSAVRTKVYLLTFDDFETLQNFIFFLPSIQFLDKLPIIYGPDYKEPEMMTSILQYPNVDFPLLALANFPRFGRHGKNPLTFDVDIRKNMPQWGFLTDQQKEEMYIDILNVHKNIYLIIYAEQKMLNMLVCAGLFQEGILMNFLLRDLYDPRLLMTICSF